MTHFVYIFLFAKKTFPFMKRRELNAACITSSLFVVHERRKDERKQVSIGPNKGD